MLHIYRDNQYVVSFYSRAAAESFIRQVDPNYDHDWVIE